MNNQEDVDLIDVLEIIISNALYLPANTQAPGK